MRAPSGPDYRRLLEFRTGLRKFLRWSEEQAERAGVTPAQHQLMLAIRGHDDPRGPTIGEAAEDLVSKHHSVVELADRAEKAMLIRRAHDPADNRIVRLTLTRKGGQILDRLGALALEELGRIAPRMRALWSGLESSPAAR
jgi:DNA-binding MarR family transcriptional regulator